MHKRAALMSTPRTAGRFGQDRDTVICLHGSTASGRQWQSLALRLRTRCTVHTPDLYGYGEAPPWHGLHRFSLADEVARIAPLIEHARHAVHLVGHSYGGAVALKAAQLYPDRVHSLALYEPVPFRLLFREPATQAAAHEIWRIAHAVRRSLGEGRPGQAAERFVDYWNGPGAWAELAVPQQAAILRRIGKVRLDFDALLSDATTLEDLAALPMPLLCLYGSRSPLASRSIARLLGDRLPHARVVRMEGLGHMGPVGDPQSVNDRLLIHLGRQSVYARVRRTALRTPHRAAV
jgi:pimeloyl-ACP methyl ester carboxylesterase